MTKNTLFAYSYRDADNYKTHEMLVLSGTLTAKEKQQIMDRLVDDDCFIPNQVGLNCLQFQMETEPDFFGSDHVWHYIAEIEDTDDDITSTITAKDLLKAFESVKEWDVNAEFNRLTK